MFAILKEYRRYLHTLPYVQKLKAINYVVNKLSNDIEKFVKTYPPCEAIIENLDNVNELRFLKSTIICQN